MARLYADLVLNGILRPDDPAGPGGLGGKAVEGGGGAAGAGNSLEEQASLGERTGPDFDPADGRLDSDAEALTADGPVRVGVRSAALYASELGVPVERLAASQAWLRAGGRGARLAEAAAAAEERLRLWLDAYQVRGSFDDRTLVVLHRGRAG
jgi:hypothetical protein